MTEERHGLTAAATAVGILLIVTVVLAAAFAVVVDQAASAGPDAGIDRGAAWTVVPLLAPVVGLVAAVLVSQGSPAAVRHPLAVGVVAALVAVVLPLAYTAATLVTDPTVAPALDRTLAPVYPAVALASFVAGAGAGYLSDRNRGQRAARWVVLTEADGAEQDG